MTDGVKKEKIEEKAQSKSEDKGLQKANNKSKKEDSALKESKTAKSSNKQSKGTAKKKDVKAVPFKYVYYLLLTEKAIDAISTKNTLVFIVDVKAKKSDVKREIENIFKVKVKKVNTLIDRKGRKKAYVSLMPGYSAEEVATQLGMM
ncbi:MAG: 50S ribosomal protein L23 [Candidatus Nanohaloarchaeota archaeon]|nr:50S ribosomal protein L23 [Candidatus Nanohaloarchaeota archaeon]